MIGAVSAMAVSCSDDKDSLVGEGQIMINPSISVKALEQESRAITAEEQAQLEESLKLHIFNSEGAIRSYTGLSNVPTGPIALLSGDYKIMAWAGDSASADYEKRFFKGETTFTVTKGATTQVDVECKIANVVVSLDIDASVRDLIQDTKVEVWHTRGALDLDNDHERIYFMMPSNDSEIQWKVETTNAATGATVQRSDKIANVQPGHEYVLKLSYNKEDDDPIDGGWLNIVIDDTMIEETGSVTVTMAPEIKGFNGDNSSFSFDDTQFATPGEMKDKYIQINTSGKFTNIYIYSDLFAEIFTDKRTSIDAVNMTDDARSRLVAAGIDPGTVTYYSESDASSVRIVFSEDFFDTYCQTEGEYTIRFEASTTDPNDETLILSSTKTLTLNISNDPIATSEVNTSIVQFSHKQAVLEGTIMNNFDTSKGVTFKYRQVGDTEWKAEDADVTSATDAEGNLTGTFKATITGLLAGTEYEFCATVTRTDGSEFTTKTRTFTTEPATQFPNNSFEDWQTSSSPYLIYAEGGEMFWDSGNHGSSTMDKNVTVPDDTYKHSGTYSIKLASQFVGVSVFGKFAAGNVFIGKYLKTDGTNGVLGWGRAFTGRPSKLHGWVKYSPVAVDYTSTDDLPSVSKGDMDQGIIYIALLDDHTETYNGEAWPVVIKTKSSERQLFDKNSSHVIAYGEQVFDETSGDGLIEFTVTLDYYKTDIRPTYVLCTAAASKGGDYFAGGSGSTMWLDDLELIYE